MAVAIHSVPLSGNRFARAYLARHPAALAAIGVDPFNPEEFDRRRAVVEAEQTKAERERVAAYLEPAGPTAAAAVARWVADGGVVVTTGQQPGLFGGPLYTAYKTASVLALAAQLEARWKRPVLPVFWVASEDHDWDEVATVHVLGPDGAPVPIAAPPADAIPRPVAERPFGASLESALQEVRHVLADKPFAPLLLDALAASYHLPQTPAAAFRRWWAWLWRETPLCLVDAAHPALKAASREVLRAEVRRSAEHARRLRAHLQGLRAAGFRPQVGLPPSASNLMFHGPQGRERLYRRDGVWLGVRSGTRLTDAELERLLEEAPQRISPNVLLRPIVERACLPTVAYVAGPAELAYYAQLPPLYEAYNLVPPVPVPRLSAILVPPETQDLLAQVDLSLPEAVKPDAEARRLWASRHLPDEARRRLDALRQAIVHGYEDLAQASGAIDPTLAPSLARLRNRALATTRDAEQRLLRHLARRAEEEIRRLRRVRAVLRPYDQPQERVLSPLSFLALDGLELLDRLRQHAAWPPLGSPG